MFKESKNSHIHQTQFIELKLTLKTIGENDTNYSERYGLVLRAVSLAHKLGYQAGFRMDSNEPRWPIAYLELPTGQVSWHMRPHNQVWDGHTTEEKYKRIEQFIQLPISKPVAKTI